jgi:hypothetical protein
MAEATKRSAPKSRSSGGSSRRPSSDGASSGNSPRRATSSRAQARSRQSRSKAGASSSGSPAGRAKGVGRAAAKVSGSAVKNVVVPMASAGLGTAAGMVGGVVLERRHRRARKVLGIPIPGTGNGLDGVVKEIRKAGEQFGHLASEVKTARNKAEDVGKALR